ncbi:hypothetical protein SALBM135S_05516 [Streptomyces alboniger]
MRVHALASACALAVTAVLAGGTAATATTPAAPAHQQMSGPAGPRLDDDGPIPFPVCEQNGGTVKQDSTSPTGCAGGVHITAATSSLTECAS